MKRWSSFVLGVSVVLGALLAGCSETTECTNVAIGHTIEMAREAVTSNAPGAIVVEACLGRSCSSASPGPTGELSFASGTGGTGGPTRGSVGAGTDGKTRFAVSYSVHEGSTELLRLLVKKGDTTLLDETAAVRWSDDECHPNPLSTTL